jgi:O-succinylbenzoate synthase
MVTLVGWVRSEHPEQTNENSKVQQASQNAHTTIISASLVGAIGLFFILNLTYISRCLLARQGPGVDTTALWIKLAAVEGAWVDFWLRHNLYCPRHRP